MNWTFVPWWSTRAILLLALVLAVLALWRWRRERRGAALLLIRFVLLAGLILLMFNPQAFLPLTQEAKPKLVVLLDTSQSMATPDVSGQSRFGAASDALTNATVWARLNKAFALDVRTFDRDSRSIEPSLIASSPLGDSSDIGAALSAAVTHLGDEKSQAGVLLISDGRATHGRTVEAAQLALARSVPVWSVCVGGPVPRHDLSMETASSELLAFSGAEVELRATLRAYGFQNRSFKVEIVNVGKVISTQEVIPDTNGTARVVTKVKAPASGEQEYVFRAVSLPEEADLANNERSVFVRAVGEKVRVLIAEGQPHWDTKFLVQSLKRDPHVDVTAVYRINADRHLAVVSSGGNETRVERDLFPRTAKALSAFDVVVLGRGAEAFFDASTEQLLADYISRRGGSVVFARGKPYGGRHQALARFEPVAWGSGSAAAPKLRPTEAARDNPIFDLGGAGSLDELLERLPVLDQSSVTLGEKPLSIVLATAGDEEGPVALAYQRYGQGKAVTFNASGLWRWSFREAGQEESEIAYQRFWLSLFQWLLGGSQFLPGADVAMTTPRRYYNSEQPLQFVISTRNLDPSVYHPRLTVSGTGRSIEVSPRARGDLFIAEAGPFEPGTYEVTLHNNIGHPSNLVQRVVVISASVEKRDVSADSESMRRVAEVSGGAVLQLADLGRLDDIVRRWQERRQLAHRQSPLWDRWWVLAALLTLLGAEWWFRRKEGLL